MKSVFLTLIWSSLFVTGSAFAESNVFTTLGLGDKSVYAGIKKQAKGMEPETYILEVSFNGFHQTKLALPKELIHREVVGLYGAEKGNLVVITQRTVEQGDKPEFHRYHTQSKAWKKLAVSDCLSFSQVKVEKNALHLTCLEHDKKGDEIEVVKKVDLPGVKLKDLGETTLPLKRVEKQGMKAELLGEVFEWQELKVHYQKNEKIIKP